MLELLVAEHPLGADATRQMAFGEDELLLVIAEDVSAAMGRRVDVAEVAATLTGKAVAVA